MFPENIWLKGSVLDAFSHNLNMECLKLLSTATSVGQKQEKESKTGVQCELLLLKSPMQHTVDFLVL